MPCSARTANGNRAEEGIRAPNTALPNSPEGEQSGLADRVGRQTLGQLPHSLISDCL
jgi:hypothetical protein